MGVITKIGKHVSILRATCLWIPSSSNICNLMPSSRRHKRQQFVHLTITFLLSIANCSSAEFYVMNTTKHYFLTHSIYNYNILLLSKTIQHQHRLLQFHQFTSNFLQNTSPLPFCAHYL